MTSLINVVCIGIRIYQKRSQCGVINSTFFKTVSGEIFHQRLMKCSFYCVISLSLPLSPKGLLGQSDWSQYFPDCGGSSQSPVDVATTQTEYDPSLTPVTPLGYSQHGYMPLTIYNNGHTGNYGNHLDFQISSVKQQPYYRSVHTQHPQM